jgi:uncharacterized protein (TIGR02646 family)
MRRITKSHAPKKLQDWCDDNKDLNHSYTDLLGTKAHAALKEKLLGEQGALCAYTGRAITDETSHVEHIKPQNKCAEWEDVEYRNVVACFPADGGDTSYGYGAPIKGGWWDAAKFISPLEDDCERRFRFAWSGHIHPCSDDHEAAKSTIEVLKLNNEELRKLRKARIDGFFGFGAKTKTRPLSISEAKVAHANIDSVNATGHLQEFCFVLKQLLPKYIAGEES